MSDSIMRIETHHLYVDRNEINCCGTNVRLSLFRKSGHELSSSESLPILFCYSSKNDSTGFTRDVFKELLFLHNDINPRCVNTTKLMFVFVSILIIIRIF